MVPTILNCLQAEIENHYINVYIQTVKCLKWQSQEFSGKFSTGQMTDFEQGAWYDSAVDNHLVANLAEFNFYSVYKI